MLGTRLRYQYLLFGCSWSQSQSGLDCIQFKVVGRYIQRRKEVCLCLAMTHTPASYHITRVHMARDGRNLLFTCIKYNVILTGQTTPSTYACSIHQDKRGFILKELNAAEGD